MKLYALGDLHLRYEVTRRALQELPAHPEDWLILAGDVGKPAYASDDQMDSPDAVRIGLLDTLVANRDREGNGKP